ncbi:MAG: hypothetical protein ABIE74_00255 [Pseudomonadota bacterium]
MMKKYLLSFFLILLFSSFSMPALAIDTDGDKYDDSVEISEGSDWRDPASRPADCDGDFNPDSTDADDDNDGASDVNDAFRCDPNEWLDTDNDSIGNNADFDDDGDGFSDSIEIREGTDPLNKVSKPKDFDKDGDPDSTDPDDDNDGYADNNDAFTFNKAEWLDTDGDGIGNNADPDDDNDGYLDNDEIVCGTDPLDKNSIPPDNDHDYKPDALDPDDDNDGVLDVNDAFPLDSRDFRDTDGDGIGDRTDDDDDGDGYSDILEINEGSDPLDKNSKPKDNDDDLIPDSIDTDDDNDGILDESDALPFDPTEFEDTDSDGIGNNADTDDDGDGYCDDIEKTEGTDSLNSASQPSDTDKDFIPDSIDPDDDNDGYNDDVDLFPKDRNNWIDTDEDGLGDNTDLDDDSDNTSDVNDAFPLDKNESIDTDGDKIGDNADPDDDNDGVVDSRDEFPKDAGKWSDIDGDDIDDNLDVDSWMDGFESADFSRWDESEGSFNDKMLNGFVAYNQNFGCEVIGKGSLIKRFGSFAHRVIIRAWVELKNPKNLSFILKTADGFVVGKFEFVSDGVLQYSSLLSERFAYSVPLDRWLKLKLIRDTSDGTIRIYIDDRIIYSRIGDRRNILIDSFEISAGSKTEFYLDDVGYWVDDDLDDDGIRNMDDPDDDNDGIIDSEDMFPLDESEWVDTDLDGIGNNEDADDDGDFIADENDEFPLNRDEWSDSDHDGIGNNAETDDDNDGVLDQFDVFPSDSEETLDADSDGIGDNEDPDDDNDGVLDSIEILYGLNSNSVDSDGDGVMDGDEIAPFEDTDGDGLINVLDPDSDNDGLTDGVEMGVTSPILGKAFILGTLFPPLSKGRLGGVVSFDAIIDHDPSTTTDPLNPDSDGAGLMDGEEDLNKNGRVDPGERDPLNSDDDTYPNELTGSASAGCQLLSGVGTGSNNILVMMFLLITSVGVLQGIKGEGDAA